MEIDRGRNIKPTSNAAPIDESHSHFIFVDTADRDWGGEIQLRSELENSFAIRNQVPLMLLVVGGGIGTLDTVVESIGSHNPIILMKGSGGISDVLARMLDKDDEVRNQILSDPTMREHMDKFEDAVSRAKQHGSVHVVDYEAQSSATSKFLDQTLQTSMVDGGDHRYRSLSGRFMIRKHVEDEMYAEVISALRSTVERTGGGSRGSSKDARERQRLQELLQFTLRCTLRLVPRSNHKERAMLVEFLLHQMEKYDASHGHQFNIGNIILTNELYALQNAANEPTADFALSQESNIKSALQRDKNVSLVFSGGHLLDYMHVRLNDVAVDTTVKDLKTIYIEKLKPMIVERLQNKDLDLANLDNELEQMGLRSQMDVHVRSPTSPVVVASLLCFVIVFVMRMLPNQLAIWFGVGLVILGLFSIVRSGAASKLVAHCADDMAERLCAKLEPDLLSLCYAGGTVPVVLDGNGTPRRWWHTLDDNQTLESAQIEHGSYILVSFEKKVDRNTNAFRKMALSRGKSNVDETVPMALPPKELVEALKALGLWWRPNTIKQNKKLSVSSPKERWKELCMWSVLNADTHLIEVFWRRCQYPIREALLVGSLCHELQKAAELTQLKGPRAEHNLRGLTQHATKGRHWQLISQEYQNKANKMIMSTANLDGSFLLGMAWSTNRLQFLRFAFNSKTGDKASELASQSHPALRENINDMWLNQGTILPEFLHVFLPKIISFHRRHMLATFAFILYFHLACTVAGLSRSTMEPCDGFWAAIVSTSRWEIGFWVWCMSLSLDQSMLNLSVVGYSERNEWFKFDWIHFSWNHVALLLRLLARSGYWSDDELADMLSTRLLYYSLIPAGLRFLGFLAVYDGWGIGTVSLY